ncbi:hypothetical protein [Demequina muriae]|uniref:Uncharacterized protein n=1 Tax=Demequina muriae TaxID=3051664 RepID=A0ABT8GFS2_9MICO|nr:hypothetical protein [Demequina sp. EGI L300058]MDN4480278.1 hypothetical protein [Demequina sp. EGI L300058]
MIAPKCASARRRASHARQSEPSSEWEAAEHLRGRGETARVSGGLADVAGKGMSVKELIRLQVLSEVKPTAAS